LLGGVLILAVIAAILYIVMSPGPSANAGFVLVVKLEGSSTNHFVSPQSYQVSACITTNIASFNPHDWQGGLFSFG